MFSSLCRFHVFLIKVIYYELISKKFRLATSKRVFAHIFLYIFITFCIIWNHIGFILDEVFFPDWQNEKINDILFIVGNARSGTTLMHRLVSMDNKHFTSMQTWEIIFASSIAWRVLFWYLYDVDQTISFGFLYTCIKYIDKILFENISKIHPCGLFQPEEDEWVLIHTFQAQLILLFYPVGLEIPKPSTTSNNGIRDVYEIWTCYLSALPDFENSLSEQLKLSIFQFYKSCIRRHLYAHHHHRRRITENRNKSNQKTKMNKLIYVSKNPVFTTRLDSLYKLFPYMKVVCMIRDPGESVPSMVSYISKVCSKLLCIYKCICMCTYMCTYM